MVSLVSRFCSRFSRTFDRHQLLDRIVIKPLHHAGFDDELADLIDSAAAIASSWCRLQHWTNCPPFW